jgi:hypothetical protein
MSAVSLATTRQHFIQEILHQIPNGCVGLAVIDHDHLSHVLVTPQGEVMAFGEVLSVLDPGAVKTADQARLTPLANLGLDDLATILDSFADPDSGAILSPAHLDVHNDRLPAYFQARLSEKPTLATAARAALAA